MSYEKVSNWSTEELVLGFKPQKDTGEHITSYYVMPDYKLLSKELDRPSVTMQLLLEEYAQECHVNNKIYYKLTQFKKYFNDYLYKSNSSHILHHKADEQVQVNWTICEALHIAQST